MAGALPDSESAAIRDFAEKVAPQVPLAIARR